MRSGDLATDPELVAAIYDAVTDPVLLPELMNRFTGRMRCDAAYFKLFDQDTATLLAGVGGGMPEGSDRDYLQNYFQSDVRVPRVNAAPSRLILDDRQVITASERRRSAFHNEWLRKYDLAHLLHVNLSPSPRYVAIVTCAQSETRGEFAAAQNKLLAAYVTHFERATSLHLRLLELGGRAVLVSAAFDRLTTAGAILDPMAKILFANAAAQEVICAGDGLAVRHGRLVATDSGASALLRRAIAEASLATADEAGRVGPNTILIGRPSGKAPYRLEVHPLPHRNELRNEYGGTGVVVFIHDPTRIPMCGEKALREFYGLTPAEAALAMAVAAGETLREYAERRDLSVGTARFQMKQIFSKTGCRRQTDLVRLISAGL